MPSADFERARKFLCSFVGKTLSAIKCDEFHMELVFEDGSRFQTQNSWRFIQDDSLLFGRGDIGGQVSKDVFGGLVGLKVASASVSNCGDTALRFKKDYIVQTISDTVQYETWDAHLDAGWVIFGDGQIMVFPPAPIAPNSTE